MPETWPSGRRPTRDWKSLTAARVFGPMTPSGEHADCPKFQSILRIGIKIALSVVPDCVIGTECRAPDCCK